jgi:hypothetical protein
MCTACGRHVDNVLLEEQNKVTIFFAKALPGLQGDAGSLWVYDNAYVIFWKSGCLIPSASVLVELR